MVHYKASFDYQENIRVTNTDDKGALCIVSSVAVQVARTFSLEKESNNSLMLHGLVIYLFHFMHDTSHSSNIANII